MNDQDIFMERTITDILQVKLLISEQVVLNPQNWESPLTGAPFRLSGMEMVYLFFELEKALEIQINSRYLSAYGFCSIKQIAKVLRQCAGQPASAFPA